MIFWGTVLAFVLGIMYYMLYPYDTKISTLYMPSSEAYVADFVTQHQAAKDYAREAVLAINRIAEKLPQAPAVSPGRSVLVLSDAEQEKSSIDAFLPYYISSMQTSSIRPGLTSSNPFSDKIGFGEGFVSLLACFDQPERRLQNSNEYTAAKLTECRAATTKYVMTYGPVPDEMDTPYMRGKILLWEPALFKRTKGNPDCGYLHYDSERKHYFINNSRHLTRVVPTAFIKFLKTGYFEGEDDGRVLVKSGANDARELMFCITPINDPYPRVGLRVLLDGTVNTLSGSTIEHSNVPTGWVNLAQESNNAITVSGANNEGQWNTSCTATSEACHADGFSFNKSRKISIPAGFFDSENSNVVLGVPSTVSFMALFHKGSYTVFETKSSGANGGSIKATYNNGKLTVTLSTGSRSYAVSASVTENEMTQVDYVLNKGEQKLYIDGKSNKSQMSSFYSDLIDSINGSSFDLGGDNADYILYNFLIYNRSPAVGEALERSMDLYGLPRIYKSNMLRYINKTGQAHKKTGKVDQLSKK